MKNKTLEKYIKMSDAQLVKELKSIKLSILNQRIDIANHKNKGIHKISEFKKDIARINTVFSLNRGDRNEQ